MRIVDIGGGMVRTAAVYFEALPENLLSMTVTGTQRGKATVRIFGVGRIQNDKRVVNIITERMWSREISKYKACF